MLKTIHSNSKLISDTELLLLSGKVVARYVKAGTIPTKEEEDVKMAIVEKFLIKHDSIKKAFSGKAKVSTYCIAVLNRMCCEIIRKELKHWKIDNNEVPDVPNNIISHADKLVISDEVKLLHKILLLFGDEFVKIKLFLAFYFQLNIYENDIAGYSLNKKVRELFSDSGVKNKGEIFECLTEAVGIVEKKEVKADAVRMWLNKNTDKIIQRLNGAFGRANYDKDSFQILFEYYYSDKLSVNQGVKKGA